MPNPPRKLAGHQERGLWTRASGNLQLNGGEGLVWIGSDQWPGLLGHDGTAEALPVVTRATSLITGPLTAAAFKVQQQSAGASIPTPRWLFDPMLLRPDGRLLDGLQAHPFVQRLPRSQFWASFIRSAIWWGVGAFVCQEDESGQPLAGTMRLIHPHAMDIEDGAWVLGNGPDAARFDREGRITLGTLNYRLVVLRNPHSHMTVEGRSLGVFEQHPSVFGLSSSIDAYAQGTFKSGVPAGYLKVNNPGLTQEQSNALKSSWLSAHGGDQRSIAVLSSTVDFAPISMSPVDAELAAVKRLAIGDVAFAFGLDPMTLGVSLGNSSTYNNVTESWSNHRNFGVSPWIASLQDVLSALLPGDRTVSVNVDGFANPPPGERYEAYKTAVDAGFLTVDEVRAMEGMPPVPADSPAVQSISEEEEEADGDNR